MNRNDVQNELNRINGTNKTENRCKINIKLKKKGDTQLAQTEKRGEVGKKITPINEIGKKVRDSKATNTTRVTNKRCNEALEKNKVNYLF